jgi:hypothetical protein
MIKKKVFSKKGNLVTDNPVALILVVLVIASVLMFLYKVDINKYLRNLPGYSSIQGDSEVDLSGEEDERTEIVESVQGDECVKNAYWADRVRMKDSEGKELGSMEFQRIEEGKKIDTNRDISIIVEIEDINKCDHKLIINPTSTKLSKIIIKDNLLSYGWINDKKNIYFYSLKTEGSGDVKKITKGTYSFEIKDEDKSRKTDFEGYEIKVEREDNEKGAFIGNFFKKWFQNEK